MVPKGHKQKSNIRKKEWESFRPSRTFLSEEKSPRWTWLRGIGLSTVIGVVACFLYYGFLETRINTPIAAPKIVTKSGLDDPERYWGTFRPGIYFGTSVRHPFSPVTGLMWFTSGHFQNNMLAFRHWCDQADDLDKYGWLEHDGRHFGSQLIRDKKVTLETHFVKRPGGKYGGEWSAQIKVLPKVKFYGDRNMEWIHGKFKENINKNVCKTKYLKIDSIIEQENLVNDDMKNTIRKLKNNELLVIYLENPLYSYLKHQHVELHGKKVLTLTFECPRADLKDIPDWVANELKKLKETIRRLVNEVTKTTNYFKVRVHLIAHPMVDLVQYFKVMCDEKEIIDVMNYNNDVEINKIISDLVVDNLHIDKYLFWSDRVFCEIKENACFVDFTSLQLCFSTSVRATKVDKFDDRKWLSGHLDLRRWNMVTKDGITTHDQVLEKSWNWLKQSFFRFYRTDYSSTCMQVFNKASNWSEAAEESLSSWASTSVTLEESHDSTTQMEVPPKRVATPTIEVSQELATSREEQRREMSVRPKERKEETNKEEILSSRDRLEHPTPVAQSTLLDISIDNEPEQRGNLATEPFSDVSGEELEETNKDIRITPREEYELNPEKFIVIDEVSYYDLDRYEINIPFGEKNYLDDVDKILMDEIKGQKLHERHELILHMNVKIRHSTPTLYAPRGAINIRQLLKLPSIEINSMLRDMAYIRGIITPFVGVIDTPKWHLNMIIENSLMFDLDYLPNYEGRMFFLDIYGIIKELEFLLLAFDWESRLKLHKFKSGVQFYYRLVYYFIGHARLHKVNEMLSSVECLRATLAIDEEVFKFFVKFEEAVVNSFSELVMDVEKERKIKGDGDEHYKRNLSPKFIEYLDKFCMSLELGNGPILSGIYLEGNYEALKNKVREDQDADVVIEEEFEEE